MYRLFKVGLVVAAAFAFTALMVAGTLAGKAGLPAAVSTPVSHACGYPVWPGMAITLGLLDWLHRPVLGDNLYFPLILIFNTFIYSLLFGLFLMVRGFMRRQHKPRS